MNDRELVLDTLRRMGKTIAESLQARSAQMTATEVVAEQEYLPSFTAAKAKMNMLQRPVGFACRSTAGRAVSLLQVYDSDIYPQEPEELPAQWRFLWSQDPAKALPFIAFATSPYATGDCCTHEGHVWRSGQDNNTWPPGTVGVVWDDLGPIEEVAA